MNAVSAPIPCVMLTSGLHFPLLRSSKVTFYPQRYAGRDGNDRSERQRPFMKREIAMRTVLLNQAETRQPEKCYTASTVFG